MAKKYKAVFGILFVFLLSIFAAGCELIKKDGGKKDIAEFERGPSGLVMEFVKNYPGDSYIVGGNTNENILVMIDARNKGTYPEDGRFSGGKIYISGFDDNIIQMQVKSKSLSDDDVFLQAASPVNPLGGFYTAEFEGQIIADKITIDEYNPTIMATACYPYATKASPTVCVDPLPFDDRQEKVCYIGSLTLETQGAPVAVTSIVQEASTNKIQFKITIKNVGNGDVLKPGLGVGDVSVLEKCNPLEKKDIDSKYRILDRKDFDRVQFKKIEIGSVDLLAKGKCSPFADNSGDTATKLIQLFNGEGFVICTLDIKNEQSKGTVFENVQSAYTTPLSIELNYNYRSTISKPIKISKLTTVGG